MIIHEVPLAGCRPEPLMAYLKALGVFRLVGEQADPTVHGCWRDGVFLLRSELDEGGLVDFLVQKYHPTPIVSPWNGGSGFFEGDATAGLDAILEKGGPRFSRYTDVIRQIRLWPEMPKTCTRAGDVVMGLASACAALRPGDRKSKLEKLIADIRAGWAEVASSFPGVSLEAVRLDDLESTAAGPRSEAHERVRKLWSVVKKGRTACLKSVRSGGKEGVLAICRARLPEECLSWLDATYVLCADGSPTFSPILGTGGNEGRLDLSNNFMQRLADLLIDGSSEDATSYLYSSLYGASVSGLVSAKIGQFDPGRAGGYNQGAEIETKEFKINPWDFILMMEGSVVLASSSVRRSLADVRGLAAIPFTVRFSGVGFPSSEYGEAGRAETWLPIWSRSVGLEELRFLFGEGRSSLGRRRAHTGIDFSRAIGSLGVDRGIDGFTRYAFVKRRGDSFVALPTGRFPVRFQPALGLLDEIDPLLGKIDGFLRQFQTVPATFATARKRIDAALFECSEEPSSARFINLVRAMGRFEFLVAQRDRSKKPTIMSPLQGLSPAWIHQCDDAAVEVRIAAALASIRNTGQIGTLRSNMAGVDAAQPWAWAAGHGQRQWYGNSLSECLAGVLSRRIMDAERLLAPVMPREALLHVSPYDIVPFLESETDDQKLEDLLWGFTLVDWRKQGIEELRRAWAKALMNRLLPRIYCLLSLLHSPDKIRGVRLRREPRIAALLRAARVSEACAVAVRRLRVSGLHPRPVIYEEWGDARRMLAALLIPVREQHHLEALVLQKPQPQE